MTMHQSQSTSLEQLRANAAPAPVQNTEISFYNSAGYGLLRNMAKDFAAADIIPQRFQKNLSNCLIALNMAARMNADPLMVMQNLYVVNGTPAWSAQFLISCFNQCGRFSSIQYEFSGKEGSDEWGCRAYAIELATGETVKGSKVTINIAKKEGWFGKNQSKWQTMPEQMLRYRSAAWMIRAHAPEIGMGFQTRDEIVDAYEMSPDELGTYSMNSKEIHENTVTSPPKVPEKAKPANKHETESAPVPESDMGKSAPESEQVNTETGEVGSGESGLGSSGMLTCPNTGKEVDELDCPGCPKRADCPEWN